MMAKSAKTQQMAAQDKHTVNAQISFFITAESALTLLVGWQEGHPACKKLSGVMLAWLCIWIKVQIHIWPS